MMVILIKNHFFWYMFVHGAIWTAIFLNIKLFYMVCARLVMGNCHNQYITEL